MITAMTQPTPEDVARKTQVVSIGSKTIVVRELTDLQMMHLARYANILQRDDIGSDLAQHREDAFGIAPAIDADGLMDVIAGEGELHGCGSSAQSTGTVPGSPGM